MMSSTPDRMLYHLLLQAIVMTAVQGVHALKVQWTNVSGECYPRAIYLPAWLTYPFIADKFVRFEVKLYFQEGDYVQCLMGAFECTEMDTPELQCSCHRFSCFQDQCIQLMLIVVRGKWIIDSHLGIELVHGMKKKTIDDGPRYFMKKELVPSCTDESKSGSTEIHGSPMGVFAVVTAAAMFRL